MKLRLFSFMVAMFVSFQLIGNHSDSLQINNLLKEGKAVYKHDKDKSINIYLTSINLADSAGYMDDRVASAKVTLSNYEYYRGQTAKAIGFALSALNYYRKKGNLKLTVKMLSLVGDILRGNSLYNQSYKYLNEAKVIVNSMSDSLLLASVYNRLAALYFEDERIPFDTTEKYALISLHIANHNGIETLIYNNLNILGGLETKRKNYLKSLKYLEQSYPIMIKTFPEDEPLVLINMARNYFLLNLKFRSEELNLKALKLAKELNIPQYIRLSCQGLEQIYLMTGDFKKAYPFVILYYQSKESILSQKVLVQLQEFNNKIALEKQRSENQRLLFEQKIEREQLRNNSIIGFLLFVLLIVSIGFLFYQNRQRQNIKLIAGKLDQSNKVLRRFISILGHDLRSPFNALLGFSDILKNEPELSDEDREMAIESLYTVSRSTFKLLESILEWSRINSESIKPVKKSCDLVELVRETIHGFEAVALLKKIEITFSSSVPVQIYADQDMILTSLRNIISNAIKFTNPGGLVTVTVSADLYAAKIEVCDNGIGIAPENIEKLFHLDDNYKSKGTGGEQGSGFGLILCKEYILLHEGALDVNSEEGKGSRFVITLPQKKNSQPAH